MHTLTRPGNKPVPAATRGLTSWLAALLALGALAATLEGAGDRPAADALVERVLAAVSDQVHSYEATRRLTATNPRTHSTGWLEVATAFDPVKGFTFDVLAEGGHRYIRTKVLRMALARERDLHARRRLPSGALTADNYELRDPSWGDDGRIRLALLPRRHGELLMRGQVVVTDDGDILEVTGRLTQNPSLWTRRVDVRRRFERINGVRALRELSSTASVLVVGESTFSMCYVYRSIDGVAVVDDGTCS